MDWLGLALNIVSGVLDKMPDYDQRKRKQYYKLLRKYNDEISKDYPQRDDNLVVTYSSELHDFLQAFSKEISGS